MGILDAFKAEMENEKLNYETPTGENGNPIVVDDTDEYIAELARQRRLIDEFDKNGTINGDTVEYKQSEEPPIELNFDDVKVMQNINDKYKKADSNVDFKVESVNALLQHNLVIKRAYCPKCGKEIVNKFPEMFNPFTMEKFNKYDCECGWSANMDHTYPRAVLVNHNTDEEIEFFTK